LQRGKRSEHTVRPHLAVTLGKHAWIVSLACCHCQSNS
jgi:hypothetical protein